MQKPIKIGLAILSVVVVILIIALIVAKFQQKTAPAAAPMPLTIQPPTDMPASQPPIDTSAATDIPIWKTYKNDKYGFEFKYPNSLLVEEYDPANEGTKNDILWLNLKNKSSNIEASIEISLYGDMYLKDNSNKKDVIYLGSDKKQVDVYIRYPLKINECYGVNNLRGGCDGYSSVMINNSKYFYIISGLLDNENISTQYKKILSTFKFTN